VFPEHRKKAKDKILTMPTESLKLKSLKKEKKKKKNKVTVVFL
jgi:hypothetical protein